MIRWLLLLNIALPIDAAPTEEDLPAVPLCFCSKYNGVYLGHHFDENAEYKNLGSFQVLDDCRKSLPKHDVCHVTIPASKASKKGKTYSWYFGAIDKPLVLIGGITADKKSSRQACEDIGGGYRLVKRRDWGDSEGVQRFIAFMYHSVASPDFSANMPETSVRGKVTRGFWLEEASQKSGASRNDFVGIQRQGDEYWRIMDYDKPLNPKIPLAVVCVQ